LTALARERALNYPMPAERYPGCERDHLRCLLLMLADRIEDLDSQLDTALDDCRRLAADKLRLDWLADPNNYIGNVQLPREIVERNAHSLRAAIDAAMGEDVN